MKAILLTISMLLMTSSVLGQTIMVIHKTDGQKVTLATSAVEKITFLEVQSTVTDIDGNIYNTVIIGTQEWTVENLRTTKYNDGTDIPKIFDPYAWTTTTSGAYCSYNNDEYYVATYGNLYNWYAVNTSKLAPSTAGWRVPTDEDWTNLINNIGGYEFGYKLKSTTGWFYDPDGIGTDEYAFSALPGGIRHGDNGFFNGLDYNSYWWSSTATVEFSIYYRYMDYDKAGVYRNLLNANNGFSVRLVRDL